MPAPAPQPQPQPHAIQTSALATMDLISTLAVAESHDEGEIQTEARL